MGKGSKYQVAMIFVLFLNLGTLFFSASASAFPSPFPPLPPKHQTCSIGNALKLGACVDVLGGLIRIGIAEGAKKTCCPLLGGLVGLEVSVCLCTAIKLKLPNIINLVVPLALDVLVGCGNNPPLEFQCTLPSPSPSLPLPSPPPPSPSPSPSPPSPSPPPPSQPTFPPPPSQQTCPIDTNKLDPCVEGIDRVLQGKTRGAGEACCPVLKDLEDSDGAVCLCTIIKASIPSGIPIGDIIVRGVLGECGKSAPGFKCSCHSAPGIECSP